MKYFYLGNDDKNELLETDDVLELDVGVDDAFDKLLGTIFQLNVELINH